MYRDPSMSHIAKRLGNCNKNSTIGIAIESSVDLVLVEDFALVGFPYQEECCEKKFLKNTKWVSLKRLLAASYVSCSDSVFTSTYS